MYLRQASMIDQDKERDHWKELAEQLGLPPEGEEVPAAESHVAEAAKSEEINEDVDTEVDVEDSFEPEPMDEHVHPPLQAVEKEEPNDLGFPSQEETSLTPRGEPEVRHDLPIESDDQAPAADLAEDKVGEGTESAEETTEHEEEEVSRGRRRRGGRGGKRHAEGKSGRGRDQGTKTKAKAESAEKKEAVSPADEDDGGDNMEDLSDWTVPSWQELISSLYRPDR
jgi:hypothetical protein